MPGRSDGRDADQLTPLGEPDPRGVRGLANHITCLDGADRPALEESACRGVLEAREGALGRPREVHVESHVHVLAREGAGHERRAEAPARDVEGSGCRGGHRETEVGQRGGQRVARLVHGQGKTQFSGRHECSWMQCTLGEPPACVQVRPGRTARTSGRVAAVRAQVGGERATQSPGPAATSGTGPGRRSQRMRPTRSSRVRVSASASTARAASRASSTFHSSTPTTRSSSR